MMNHTQPHRSWTKLVTISALAAGVLVTATTSLSAFTPSYVPSLAYGPFDSTIYSRHPFSSRVVVDQWGNMIYRTNGLDVVQTSLHPLGNQLNPNNVRYVNGAYVDAFGRTYGATGWQWTRFGLRPGLLTNRQTLQTAIPSTGLRRFRRRNSIVLNFTGP